MSHPTKLTGKNIVVTGAAQGIGLGVVEELMEQTGKTRSEVSGALENLHSTIKRRRDSALQLTEVAGRWIFEVRPTLSSHLPESVRPDVPARLLPAAALIAYHQPMKQAQLVDMIGPKAYDRVRELAGFGFIDRRRDGLTRRLPKKLRTTIWSAPTPMV